MLMKYMFVLWSSVGSFLSLFFEKEMKIPSLGQTHMTFINAILPVMFFIPIEVVSW